MNWICNKAYFLGKCNFNAINLIIPMAFPRKEDRANQSIIDVKNGRSRSEGRVASQGLHVEWVMNVVAHQDQR